MDPVKKLFISRGGKKISPQVLLKQSAERELGVFTSTGSCEVSLTVLQRERRAVHGLALGRGTALRVGRGTVDVAAAEAGAQLQAPHVADDGRCVKSLLQRQAR